MTLATVAVVVLACCGVPLVWVAGPLVVGTLNADHGEGSPGAALLAFVTTFEDGPDATGVERLIVPDRRRLIVAQRRVYLGQMAADVKATGWSATFEVGSSMPGDRVETHSDRATVVDSYRVRWTPPPYVQRRMSSNGPVLWFNGSSRQWRAEARKDHTGGDCGRSPCRRDAARTATPSATRIRHPTCHPTPRRLWTTRSPE